MSRVALIVAVVALLVGASESRAAVQSIRVEVPAVRVCTSTSGGIKIGVRWLSGPRRYGVRVYDPNNKIVLTRRGLATHTWRRWAVDPTLGGTYRTVYSLPGRTARYRTQSLGCGD
jgi:hypothetical protein